MSAPQFKLLHLLCPRLLPAASWFLLAAGAAWGQSVATVYVGASEVRLTSGASVPLTAVARDAAGNEVANAAFQWSSNNSSIVRVDSSGLATAAGLGLADITATSGGRQGILRLQVLPKRIEVTPAGVDVKFGARHQFSAVAYDINDQPIPDVPFTWRVMVGGGVFDSTTVPVNQAGVVTGGTLGYYVLRASVTYPATPNEFERVFDGSTTFRVVPGDYQLTPLVGSHMVYPSFRLRGKRSAIAANDSGRVAFSAALDGLSTALMAWQSAGIEVLATSGAPGVVPNTLVYDFENPSIDSKGNVLASANMIGTGTSLVLVTAEGPRLLLGDRAAADVVLDVTGISTNRHSLSDSGDVAFRANFRYDGSTVNYSGLLRYSSFGVLTLEVSSRDALPGLTAPVSFDDQYGLDGQGNLYFSASSGSARAVFRKTPSGSPVKVIALGDSLNGVAVTQLSQIAAAGGDLVVRASLANGPQILARYTGGSGTPAIINSAPGYINQLYAANSGGGVVWLGDAGNGYGLYLWPVGASASRLVLPRLAPAPTGEPIVDFYSAAVDAAGNVYAAVRGADTPWMLMRAGASPLSITASGALVNVPANIDIATQVVPGDRTGPLHLLAGGNQPSVFQVDKTGLQPFLVWGDRMPGGVTYFGNYQTRKSPAGDLYVSTDNSVYRISGSRQTQLATFPYPLPDGVTQSSPNNAAVNDSGQYLMIGFTNSNHQRLTILDGKSARVIGYFQGAPPFQTPSPAGGTFVNANDIAINDAGQVMISATVNGGPAGLYLYDGTAWQSICPLGSCRLDGENIASIGPLRVAGNRFCSVFTNTAARNRLDCWESGTWTNILRAGDFTSDGTEINNIGAFTFDVNRRGDVAITGNTAGFGGPNIFVKTANGFTTAYSVAFPTPDDSFLISVHALDLRDDRRLYIIGQDYSGRIIAYEASPSL